MKAHAAARAAGPGAGMVTIKASTRLLGGSAVPATFVGDERWPDYASILKREARVNEAFMQNLHAPDQLPTP